MGYTSRNPVEQLLEARILAVKLHAGKRYGDLPYEVHLDHVVGVLQRFGAVDLDLLAAGYLHDAQEDTEASKTLIALFTNDRVAELVDAVSDGEGANRKERKERPFTLIPQVPDAIILKLADRIANLENGHAQESSLVGMYRKEQPEFEARLYDERKVEKGKDPRLARMWRYCRMLIQ
jgi:(p)ppGpp synthase/HD superfamily hydrolase